MQDKCEVNLSWWQTTYSYAKMHSRHDIRHLLIARASLFAARQTISAKRAFPLSKYPHRIQRVGKDK